MTAMKTTTTTMMPQLELRETLRRFGWLVGMLAVISVVTAIAHGPLGQLIQERQMAKGIGQTPSTMLAKR
jgi:hypothetical protein